MATYTFDLEKFLKDLTGSKGLAAVTDEFEKIKAEVTRLRTNYGPEAQRRLKKAQSQLKKLRTRWDKNQKSLEKEVDKTLKGVRKAAQDAESQIKKALKLAPRKKGSSVAKAKARKKTSSKR